MTYKFQLPAIEEQENKTTEVESILISVRDQVDDAYNGRINLMITPSSTFNNNKEKVLSYALYLLFVNRGSFNYRLMEINCKKADGGLPVEVVAFLGPQENIGYANTTEELTDLIDRVFTHQRTRNIIFENYSAK